MINFVRDRHQLTYFAYTDIGLTFNAIEDASRQNFAGCRGYRVNNGLKE